MPGEPVAEITAYLPYWIVRWGRVTGTYWAVPNWDGAPDKTIEAPDVAALDERMTEIENNHPQP